MPRDALSMRDWDSAWRHLAHAQFEAFIRASTRTEALEVWRRAQVLDDARKLLSDGFAQGDLELMAKLNPIDPFKELEP